ncbi:hypothetical protein GFL39_25915 [Rhizobium leguminosarum bv. viciae]|uniref:hypothetical protein n=1 Tax=Rhizobium leguminosarum TaxID=384 RepID=UPI0014416855|nr:hypothetical protein [Rhizobium leguminosarum]NKL08309.1 hypothetical protein [Rhizobium leguminosarum bv. viciae]
MIKALIAPYLGYVYAALAVLVVTAGAYAYNVVYDRGWDANEAVWLKKQADQVEANDRAIANATKELREDIAALVVENGKLENDVARLNEEALQDPDAHSGGIKRSSVQRINSVR